MSEERYFQSVNETAKFLDNIARDYVAELSDLNCLDKDDLRQEVLEAYSTHQPDLPTITEAEDWCHKALTARLNKKRGQEHLPLPETVPAEVSGAYSRSLELQPETALENRELGVIVYRAREAASPVHQVIMDATLDQELTDAAAATELNLPLGSVKSGKRIGKRETRKYLTQHHPEIL
jgi:DNA-directed RNA polymerase specialized sigma24 family protein